MCLWERKQGQDWLTLILKNKNKRIEDTYLRPLTRTFKKNPFNQRIASRRVGRLKSFFLNNFNATAAYLDGVVSGKGPNDVYLEEDYIKQIPVYINKYGSNLGALAAQGRADAGESETHYLSNRAKWRDKWYKLGDKYPGLTDTFNPWVSKMMDINDDDEVIRRWDRKWRKTLAIDEKNKYQLDTININQFPDDFATLNPITHKGKKMYAGKIKYSNGETRYFVEVPEEKYRLKVNTKYNNKTLPATYQNEKIKSFYIEKTKTPARHKLMNEEQQAVQQQRVAQAQTIAKKSAEPAPPPVPPPPPPPPAPKPVPKKQDPMSEVYAHTQNQIQKISKEDELVDFDDPDYELKLLNRAKKYGLVHVGPNRPGRQEYLQDLISTHRRRKVMNGSDSDSSDLEAYAPEEA